MTATSSVRARGSRRRTAGAARLLTGGVLLTLPSLFLAGPAGTPALGETGQLGWLMLALGVCVVLGQHIVRRNAAMHAAPGTALFFAPYRGLHRAPLRAPGPARSRAGDPEATELQATEPQASQPQVNEAQASDTIARDRGATASDAEAAGPAAPARPKRWDAGVLRRTEPQRFEALIEAMFAQTGYETRSQSHGADGGADVWLYSSADAVAPAGVVQCRHWAGNRVGVEQIRELKELMASRGVRHGHFATTSVIFTPESIAFARSNGIDILDIHRILRLIDMRPEADRQALLALAA